MFTKLTLGTVAAGAALLVTAPMAGVAAAEPALYADFNECAKAAAAKKVVSGGATTQSFSCQKVRSSVPPGVAGCPPPRPGHDGCLGNYYAVQENKN